MSNDHWIAVVTEDNWAISVRERLLGLGKDAERRLARMAKGDHVWIYVNRKHVDRQVPRVYEIRAIARISGPIEHRRKSPWKPRGDQRFLVARPIVIERTMAFPAIDILKRLSFAGPPRAWGVRLLNAPLRLTSADVAKLEVASKSATGKSST